VAQSVKRLPLAQVMIPGMEPHVGFPDHQGACFLPFPLLLPMLMLSPINKILKNK